MSVNTAHTELGRVISFQEVEAGLDIKSFVDEYKVIILRGASLTIGDQISLTQKFGEIEEAWEDHHPESKFLQLMDSRHQKNIEIKSSSKYWHLDRSFMPRPTRFTILHAKKIGPGARGTQFLNSRRILASLPASLGPIRELKAEHNFSFRFPKILEAKGISAQNISAQMRNYLPSVHPLVARTRFGEGLYFSELCTSRILGVSHEDSVEIISRLSTTLNKQAEIFEHVWQPNDTLIWDNFATIHRARPGGISGIRVLHRSTAS